jgi:hypothetical protein
MNIMNPMLDQGQRMEDRRVGIVLGLTRHGKRRDSSSTP